MNSIISFWEKLSSKKRGLLFVAAGMLCLAGYFSLGLNIIGLYILMWIKDRRDKK